MQSIALECDEATAISKRQQVSKALETYPDLTRWNLPCFFVVFLKSHLFKHAIVPATLSKLALPSIRDLRPLGWKIPLSSSTLRPVTKACYSWWWQIKLQFYNTKWRTLPTVLAPPGVILRQTVHNLPQTGSFPLSESKLLPCDGKCLLSFFFVEGEKKNCIEVRLLSMEAPTVVPHLQVSLA